MVIYAEYERSVHPDGEAVKRAEARAPLPERAVHGASPFVHQVRSIFRESS
jgi:hypothetical protein